MKCFYHSDREAVGTCQTCGKSLCRECAEKYTPLSCDDCHREMIARSRNEREKAKQDALIDTKAELIKATVIGLIFGIFIVVFIGLQKDSHGAPMYKPLEIVQFFFFGMGLPYGWALTSHFMPLYYGLSEEGFFRAFILNILKLGLSLILGIPAFLYQIIRLIVRYVIVKKS